MGKQRKILIITIAVLAALLIAVGSIAITIRHMEFGYSRAVSDEEKAIRDNYVATAESWLETAEGSEDHLRILSIYNDHEPLAQGYPVQPEDNWCATFVSAVAIQCGLTDIIPTECGCQRQIDLFDSIGCWVEADDHIPLPGDIIYYATSAKDPFGDCTAWSDHVGIVAGTCGNNIKVIEGNNNNAVSYRYIRVDAPSIRGYATPDYNKAAH